MTAVEGRAFGKVFTGPAMRPRCLDKRRALLTGRNGAYHLGCSLDQQFLKFAGITVDGLRAQLAAGKSDDEIPVWTQANATQRRTPEESEAWARHQEKTAPQDANLTVCFAEARAKVAPHRADIASRFALLDVDDYASFGGRPGAMTHWKKTPFTLRLGIEYPIVQGPFGGGLSSTRLAAIVSNAGGLGSYGAHVLSGAEIHALVAELRSLTSRPFNVNLWVPLPGETALALSRDEFAAQEKILRPMRERLGLPPPEPPASYSAQSFNEQLAAVIEARPPVASFIFGPPPAAAIAEMKRRGILTIGTATTVDEAIALEAAGMDLIVATGSDAGGHRVSFLRPAAESLVGTFSLVPQVVDAVRVPVIAAGGISDGRGIAAALVLGASAAQIGTGFLACDESGASEAHKAELVKPTARFTSLTRVFSGRLARGIRNQAMIDLEASGAEPPPYPIRSWFFSPINRAAREAGRTESMAMWSGQAAGLVRRRPAADFFATLVADTERALAKRTTV